MKRTALLYTDNTLRPDLWDACQRQLRRCLEEHDLPLVTVSHQPVAPLVAGARNVVVDLPRSAASMFRQILIGLRETDAEIVHLVEHDVLYHPSHFALDLPGHMWMGRFWYNRNQWHVDAESGRAVYFQHDDPSQLCAERSVLLAHYTRVVEWVEMVGYHSSWGFSPPKGLPKAERQGETGYWFSNTPNIDIRHAGCLTRSQWKPEDFRNAASCRDFKEALSVPGWGITRGRFGEFLAQIRCGEASDAPA